MSEPLSMKDLQYLLNHVFLPPKLPQEDDSDQERDIVLCQQIYSAALEFTGFLSQHQQQKWSVVSRMLEMLLHTTCSLDKGPLITNILQLADGGWCFYPVDIGRLSHYV
jgi:hypothetical protein